jgi:hypothetical protein
MSACRVLKILAGREGLNLRPSGPEPVSGSYWTQLGPKFFATAIEAATDRKHGFALKLRVSTYVIRQARKLRLSLFQFLLARC